VKTSRFSEPESRGINHGEHGGHRGLERF
jgi:hypothetical protein